MDKRCIVFKYHGRFAHFLKAEANASAPTYPMPPRTVLLGLAGAILGLKKDTPQVEIKTAKFAVRGGAANTHWHSANLRKIPPAPVSKVIKKSDKGSSGEQKNTIIAQEWLYNPEFQVWAILPGKYHNDFEQRIKEKKWYFTPSLGLSEMIAYIDFIDSIEVKRMKEGNYNIVGLIRQSEVEINFSEALKMELSIKSIRMPREVSENRTFLHETYIMEMNSKSIPVTTSNAWKIGDELIMWI